MALLREARDARPCAGHPRLCSIKQERRGWPGRSPAMTKKRIVFKLLGRARKSWLHFRSGSEEPRILRAVSKDEATEPENALRLEIPPFRRGAAEDIGLVAGGDKEFRRFGLDRAFPLAASMLYYAPPRNRQGGTRKRYLTQRA